MADDTKKVLFPKDKNQDGNLDNDFTAQDADYAALPDVARSGQDDLPVDPQQPVDNVEAVSISSARRKVLNDTRLNPRQPDDSSIASSGDQFVTESQKAGTLNRPSRTVTLGQFLKKGAPGRRISQADTTGVDNEGNPIRQRLGGDILKDVRTEPLGRRAETPHGRSVAGSPGEAYGEINVQPGSGDVVRKTVSAVLSQNRFSALDNKVYAADNGQSNPDEKVVSSFQPEVGAYNPNASPVQGAQEGRSYTLDDLKSIGTQMLAQSAGFSREASGARETNPDLRNASKRINVDELRPRNLTSVPIGFEDFDASKASTGQFDEPDGGEPIQTYGQLNTPNAFFDGLLPGEMKKLADSIIALTIEAVSSAGDGQDLLSLITNNAQVDKSLSSVPYNKGRFVNRNHNSQRAGALRTDLGFTYTTNDFQESVNAGIALMFGHVDPDNPVLEGQKINLDSSVTAAKDNIASTPGFYVNFCRAILRDAENLAEAFKDINPEIAKGTTKGVAGAYTMIEAFRSSKLVAGLNVLATTGDTVLTRGQSPYNIDQIASSGDFAFAPFGMPIEGGFFHYRASSHATKSRDGRSEDGQSPESIRLAWRNSSVPSMYLLPTEMEFGSILNVANTVSNDSPVAGHVAMEGITKASSEGRLAQEFVENTERILDAEYVPFYFHDLRTGEIIAFHAFLNDLSDGFNAQFSTNTVIGRTEPIRTYSNTSRDIGFSFYVAATSKEDFDEMWFKINKLVTMLYPQYTKGRSTDERIPSNGTGLFGLGSFKIRPKFIMPFSQVQSASPMIRLRIGDVIKTNYSKFNLSRLFGLGTEDFSAFPDAHDFNKQTLELLKMIFEGLDYYAADRARVNGTAAQAAASFTRSSGLSSINALEFLRLGRRKAKLKPNADDKALLGMFSQGLGIGDVVRLSYPSVRYLYRQSGKGPEKLQLPLKDTFAKVVGAPVFDDKGNCSYPVKVSSSAALARFAQFNVSGNAPGTYLLNHHDATLIPHGLLAEMLVINGIRLVTGATAAIFGGLLEGGAFLNNTNNAVARSFDQTSGKGLPGYISRMSFNWINNDTTWETSKGSKAPKIARIQCQFQPVHDIAPGLDHKGYNRAPVYQVGDVMNEIVGKSGDLLDSDLAEAAADAAGLTMPGGISGDIKSMKLDDD